MSSLPRLPGETAKLFLAAAPPYGALTPADLPLTSGTYAGWCWTAGRHRRPKSSAVYGGYPYADLPQRGAEAKARGAAEARAQEPRRGRARGRRRLSGPADHRRAADPRRDVRSVAGSRSRAPK